MSISAAFIVPHPPIIVPSVGGGRETLIKKTIDSFKTAAERIKEISPETIIVISPHSVSYADYIHISPGKQAEGNLRKFGAPDSVKADYDEELVKQIESLCDQKDFPAGTLGEQDRSLDHGTLVPLYFVNTMYTSYRLVRISISGLSRQEHYRFGMIVKEAVETLGRNAVIIASGDLSHKLTEDGPYGFAPEGPALDEKLVDIMRSGNFYDFFELDDTLCERGAQCGLLSFIIMAGALNKKSIMPSFLSYEGPFGVGYAVCAYEITGDDATRNFLEMDNEKNTIKLQAIRENEDIFVKIAREALEGYVATGRLPKLPDGLSDDLLTKRAGVFVSIKKEGKLRGCIGTIEATMPDIAQEIRHNAISSGTKDPRFPPVGLSELPDLVYSVDVLSNAEPISDKTMLDVKRYGVIVTCGYKRGLLLPNLDGVDTVDEQILIACQKAGINENEDYSLERFEVVRHK